jgi:hypothetical protein
VGALVGDGVKVASGPQSGLVVGGTQAVEPPGGMLGGAALGAPVEQAATKRAMDRLTSACSGSVRAIERDLLGEAQAMAAVGERRRVPSVPGRAAGHSRSLAADVDTVTGDKPEAMDQPTRTP